MKRRPLITVITASYYSDYIYEAIDSVLAQTYPNIEYIITDDGTNDFKTKDIECYILDKKRENIVSFQVIHHKKNLGTVRNLNSVLRICKGEYIFQLSADDLYTDENVLEKWVQDMENKHSYLSTACFQKYNEDFSHVYFSFPFEYQKQLLLSQNRQYIFDELAIENFVYGCSTARSRKCIEEFGLYDEKYYLIEDYPYILSYVRKGGKIDLFDCVCIKYRRGGVSSPDRFNTTYEKDSDLIFANEILPFVKSKWLYKLIYFQWKKNQKMGFWEKTDTSNVIRKVSLYLTNPIQICISLKHRVMKWHFKTT